MALAQKPQPLEAHSACLAAALHRRAVRFGVVLGARRAGQPKAAWLSFAVAGRHWFYRFGQLLVSETARLETARHINGPTAAATSSKLEARRRFAAAGIAIAPGAVFAASDVAGALAWFEKLGGEVCVKPDRGTQGDAVTTHVGDATAFRAAFDRVTARYNAVVVERMLEGEVIRVLCLDGKAIATRQDRAASVVGDGHSTVAGLVAAKNLQRVERALPGYVPLELDDEALFYLARQELSPQAVPGEGRRVWLRAISQPSRGSDIVSGPPGLHPAHVALAESACGAFPGLRLAGYDLMVAHRGEPGDAWMLEVNSSPGISYFHHPWEGPPVDVAGRIVDWILAGT